jgi:hypothetical protein
VENVSKMKLLLGLSCSIADDVKIIAPTEVIRELVEGFPALAWEEVGLTTQ